MFSRPTNCGALYDNDYSVLKDCLTRNKGKTRINFRGSGTLGVLDLAAQFNGGGHRQAAGAILDCNVVEAIERVIPKAVEHLKQQ